MFLNFPVLFLFYCGLSSKIPKQTEDSLNDVGKHECVLCNHLRVSKLNKAILMGFSAHKCWWWRPVFKDNK